MDTKHQILWEGQCNHWRTPLYGPTIYSPIRKDCLLNSQLPNTIAISLHFKTSSLIPQFFITSALHFISYFWRICPEDTKLDHFLKISCYVGLCSRCYLDTSAAAGFTCDYPFQRLFLIYIFLKYLDSMHWKRVVRRPITKTWPDIVWFQSVQSVAWWYRRCIGVRFGTRWRKSNTFPVINLKIFLDNFSDDDGRAVHCNSSILSNTNIFNGRKWWRNLHYRMATGILSRHKVTKQLDLCSFRRENCRIILKSRLISVRFTYWGFLFYSVLNSLQYCWRSLLGREIEKTLN